MNARGCDRCRLTRRKCEINGVAVADIMQKLQPDVDEGPASKRLKEDIWNKRYVEMKELMQQQNKNTKDMLAKFEFMLGTQVSLLRTLVKAGAVRKDGHSLSEGKGAMGDYIKLDMEDDTEDAELQWEINDASCTPAPSADTPNP